MRLSENTNVRAVYSNHDVLTLAMVSVPEKGHASRQGVKRGLTLKVT